ncbi:Cysteine metabolism repressor [Veillonella criceti]|uniref:Cysteine metabolism repressor n=1 Tax=Veillonella criceti TaxID=103891 RepID=A0A380NM39_9FIRM|nr:Rrf2 family transcriptional regulator [Veillonella criceti]SUP44196.1 Cysteine metabolism repressor [Veillonella criceti]
MKISTKGRYALRVLVDLAENGKKKNVSIREIAERQRISDKYLEGIVARLSAAGYVKSVRGKYGGYRLSKEPKEYTVYDILRAAEDSIALVACLEDEVNQCPRSKTCMTLPLWEHMQAQFKEYMEKLTLQDVLDKKFDVPADDGDDVTEEVLADVASSETSDDTPVKSDTVGPASV